MEHSKETKPLEGEVICQFCGAFLGTYQMSASADKPAISHGTCQKCKEEIHEPELEELKKLLRQEAIQSVAIINQPDLSSKDKVEELKIHRLDIENFTGLELNEDNLPQIAEKLKEKFGL